MYSRKILIILLYITIVMLIFTFKPSMMFDINGNIKHFDYQNNNIPSSLLSIEIVLPIIAILCFFIILIFELLLM